MRVLFFLKLQVTLLDIENLLAVITPPAVIKKSFIFAREPLLVLNGIVFTNNQF